LRWNGNYKYSEITEEYTIDNDCMDYMGQLPSSPESIYAYGNMVSFEGDLYITNALTFVMDPDWRPIPSNNLFRSEDNGVTWSVVTSNFSSTIGRRFDPHAIVYDDKIIVSFGIDYDDVDPDPNYPPGTNYAKPENCNKNAYYSHVVSRDDLGKITEIEWRDFSTI